MKRKVLKRYQTQIQKRNTIKGKVLLSESIKTLEFLYQQWVCNFDEFSPNILENQILKYTLMLLKPIAKEDQLLQINRFLTILKNVSEIPITPSHFMKLRYNRFNDHYHLAHSYCRMIIEQFFFSNIAGDFHCFSVLLNSWDIYEKYLRAVLADKLPNYDVTKESLQEPWEDLKDLPDISIKKNTRYLLVADAKYKTKWNDHHDYNQAAGYLQDLKVQFPITFLSKNWNILLIYPNDDPQYRDEIIQQGRGNEYHGWIWYYTINLMKIDQESYLDAWVEKINAKFLCD